MKKCFYCAEEIQNEAIVCKHCGRDLRAPIATARSGTVPHQIVALSFLVIVLAVLIFAMGQTPLSLIVGISGIMPVFYAFVIRKRKAFLN